MNTQFKKGVLEMCILYLLSQSDMYGYEIMKRTKQAFPDVYEGTIYTVLRRLSSEQYTRMYTGKSTEGPTRKYYSLTDSGKTYLESGIEEWKRIRLAVTDIGID